MWRRSLNLFIKRKCLLFMEVMLNDYKFFYKYFLFFIQISTSIKNSYQLFNSIPSHIHRIANFQLLKTLQILISIVSENMNILIKSPLTFLTISLGFDRF